MNTHDPGLMFAGVFLFFWLGAIVVGIALTIFWIVELIDVARREFPDQNVKIVWLLVVLLTHTIGAILYYFVGKKQGHLPGQGTPPRLGY